MHSRLQPHALHAAALCIPQVKTGLLAVRRQAEPLVRAWAAEFGARPGPLRASA